MLPTKSTSPGPHLARLFTRCLVPGCDNTTATPQYNEPFTNFTIPSHSECRRFWRYNLTADTCLDADFDDNITVSCTEFVFDDSLFKTSFATQVRVSVRE